MGRALIERRLVDVSDRMKRLAGELAVAEDQLAHFVEEAEEARLRALVSETPQADVDHHQAERHASAMRRHRDQLAAEAAALENTQNDLLDRLVAAGT